MKVKLFSGMAGLVVGLLVCASSASAALTYFDAQIVDLEVGKATFPANTVMCAPGGASCTEVPFTALPNGPGGEGPPPTTDPNGNWKLNDGNGSDNFWNERAAANFGNPNLAGAGTVYESLGQNGGPNTEDPAVLKTTVSVAPGDVGTTRGVYALFWTDQSTSWKIAASLDYAPDEFMPVFTGNSTSNPAGYVFGVYDVGAGDPGNFSDLDLEMNGYTTSGANPGGVAGTNRRLKAAFLGNVELGNTLSVYVGDGPAPTDPASGNFRTWYDGIAYGDTQDLLPLPNVPEPASLVLVGIAVAGFGVTRRRR